jgi:adenine-specific DNA-methyltransferase
MPQRDYSHLSAPDLVELLKQRDAHAHFGLVWERDLIEKDKHLNDEFVGLELAPDLCHGAGPHHNLVIEGDNFDALRHLLMTHAGRVNVIYIDPPYNTGSTSSTRQGWVYNDKFFDPNSKYRHSTWLEFMFPRLQLACDLLADDGVFMASIDDTELFNLKLLLDRVFGPKNFVANIVWHNSTSNHPTRVTVEHEYILVYTKKKDANPAEWKSADHPAKQLLLEIGEQLNREHKEPAKLQEAYTAWYRENKEFLGPLADYKFIDTGGVYAGSRSVHKPDTKGYRYGIPHPTTGRDCKMPANGYRYPEDTMKQLVKDGLILFGEDETKIVELKVYADEFMSKLPSVIELDGRKGANELKSIFAGVLPFNNPKPTELMTQLLTFVSKPHDIVLDFFAGSGTTAHAVAKLNAQDGGDRTFIAVSSTEARLDGSEEEKHKNICRDVCGERLRRVLTTGPRAEFAYLKATPILRHRLERELTNQVVWNAVCLAHRLPISKLDGKLGWARTAEGVAVAYPTGTKSADVAKFVSAAAAHKGPVICYAWAAPRFASAVPRAQVFSLPETLLGNFRKSVVLLEDVSAEQATAVGEEE